MANPLNILMVIPSLPVGGAEWAFVRLASALAQEHRVTVYVPYRCDSATALVKALNGVTRLSLPIPHPLIHRAFYKLSLLLQRVWPAFDLEQRLHSLVLRLLHRFSGFDVVNPHLRSGTMMACHAFRQLPVPIVETDHGDYALLMREDPELMRHQLLMQRVDAVICPSSHNAVLIALLPWNPGFQHAVIPNSMPASMSSEARTDPTFTFGMVARGVQEKGWIEAIAAFRQLRQRLTTPMRLVLVGGGAFMEELARTVGNDDTITFTGYQEHPADWITSFDVGLLPSHFAGESLPYAIIECLTLGKPVIATAVGGVPEMLDSPDGPCGILIPLAEDTGCADVNALAEAMHRLAADPRLLETMATRARKASLRYDATTCSRACATFFRHIQDSHLPSTRPARSVAGALNII